MISGIAENGLPFIDDGSGHRRILAALKPKKKYSQFAPYMDSFPTIPRDQWTEFEEDDSMLRILDQDGHGSCVGHGSDSAFEYCWYRTNGASKNFSANYLYSLVNGGSDNGAVVGDAADALQQKGICLDTTVPEGNVIYTRQMPAGAATEAQRFKAGTIYRVSNFDQIVTALLKRDGVVIGIDCGMNFTPDSNGVLPNQRGSGGGHCLFLRLGLKKINGLWHVKGQNSWSNRWGVNGRFWMNESFFTDKMGDHFVIATVLADPVDPNNLPKAG